MNTLRLFLLKTPHPFRFGQRLGSPQKSDWRHRVAACGRRGLGLAVIVVVTTALPAESRSAETGRVAGRVVNADTKLHLEGALVELRELGWQTFTGKSGEFLFAAVAPGAYTLVSSYTGVDTHSRPIRLGSGERVDLTVELRSAIYKMEGFVVTGEREGNAASITRQRNSANVRTVLSLDALGSLPSENMGELLIRMPGVAGGLNEEGVIATVGIRGTPPAMNTLKSNFKIYHENFEHEDR